MKLIHLIFLFFLFILTVHFSYPSMTFATSQPLTTYYPSRDIALGTDYTHLGQYINSHLPTYDIKYNITYICNSVLSDDLSFDVLLNPFIVLQDTDNINCQKIYPVSNVALTFNIPFTLTTFKDHGLQIAHDSGGFSYITPVLINSFMPFVYYSNKVWWICDSKYLYSLSLDNSCASVFDLSDSGLISNYYYSSGHLYLLLRKGDIELNVFVYVTLNNDNLILSNYYQRQSYITPHILGNKGIYILDGTRVVLLNEEVISYDLPISSGNRNFNMSLYSNGNTDRVVMNNNDICYILSTDRGDWEILYEIEAIETEWSRCYYWDEGLINYDIWDGNVEYYKHNGEKVYEVNTGIRMNPIQLAIFDKDGNCIIGYEKGVKIISYESGVMETYEMAETPIKIHEDNTNIYIQTMEGGLYKIYNSCS